MALSAGHSIRQHASILYRLLCSNWLCTAVQEKGPGAPAGDNYLNPGETPKAGKKGDGRKFSTYSAAWADDDTAKGRDGSSTAGKAKGSHT